jgi:hypothetical protein
LIKFMKRLTVDVGDNLASPSAAPSLSAIEGVRSNALAGIVSCTPRLISSIGTSDSRNARRSSWELRGELRGQA